MKEIFLRYRVIFFRVFGSLLLMAGFVVYFWSTPEEVVLSENDIAAINVARMEASVRGASSAEESINQPDISKIVDELKNAQEKQLEQMTLLAMAFGIGFLIYSFTLKGKKE